MLLRCHVQMDSTVRIHLFYALNVVIHSVTLVLRALMQQDACLVTTIAISIQVGVTSVKLPLVGVLRAPKMDAYNVTMAGTIKMVFAGNVRILQDVTFHSAHKNQEVALDV